MYIPFDMNFIYTEKEFYSSENLIKFVYNAKLKTKFAYSNHEINIYFEKFFKFQGGSEGKFQKMIKLHGISIGDTDEKETEIKQLFETDKDKGKCIINLEQYMERHQDYIKRSWQEKDDEDQNCEEETDDEKEDDDNDKKESELREKISKFVNRENAFKDFDNKVHERILGQPNISEITYNVFMWLRSLSEGNNTRCNAMIAAPSGCGKTETYRVIHEILKNEIADIPVIQIDVTQLTAEGFRGKDMSDSFEPLIEKSINGIGIVVLDEIDKRIVPSYTSHGSNVNSEIQAQLLTFIEGTVYESTHTDTKIDTSNTLFIAAGAFQSIRENKKNKQKDNKSIGFYNASPVADSDVETEDITITDMIENGALCELIGRFSTVINLHKLNRLAVATICRRYADEMEEQIMYKITLKESAIDELFEIYENNNLGCRILKSTLWNKISPICINLERNGFFGRDKKIEIIYGADKVTYKVPKSPKCRRPESVF